MPEGAHEPELIGRHLALGIVAVLRLGAAPVAPEIGGDDCEMLRKLGRDAPPHHVRLRRAVQEKKRRAHPAAHRVDGDAVHIDVERFKGREERRVGHALSLRPRNARANSHTWTSR